MTRSSNPYKWQRTEAKVEIRRPEVGEIAETLCDGDGVLVLGGRGMGKSVFLGQLRREIERIDDGTTVVAIPKPPARLNFEACMGRLAKSLGVEATPSQDASDLVEAWFDRPESTERLVLLFDEFDKYTDSGAARPLNPPGRAFFNDLELTRRERSDLGILAAGSVGVFAFRDAVGSSFLSRAEHKVLLPFERDAIVELAAPFAERGQPLSDEVVDALLLASGGIPALVVYGLEELWELPEPVERDVTVAYARFQERHVGYIDDVYRAFVDRRLSQAPRRVLELFRQSDGSVPRDALTEACEKADNPLELKLTDVLMVLCAAGLLRLEGSFSAGNPVRGRAIPSILDLPTDTPPASDFQDRLYRDLGLLLDKLHRASADFYRQGAKAGEKRLVPESVFAAHLALGFEFLGWRAEREAQSAAGRTDIQLRYNGGTKVAVIEVKIWGRPGARDAQRQVESYWTAGVEACAVVQISDAASDGWIETYRGELEGTVEPLPNEGSAWTCLAVRRPENAFDVLHFLLRLPRR